MGLGLPTALSIGLSITMTWIAPLILATISAIDHQDGFDPFSAASSIELQAFGSECDTDFDGLPDGWTRRSGTRFPHYVDVRIDRQKGHNAPGSLAIKSDGAAAVLYNKPVRVDAGHVHFFEAFVRTQSLKGDAAICSVSILDEQMNRIERYLTTPVSGTHADWVRLRIGPIEPVPHQRFLVVGCHLVCGKQLDLGGVAYFDDIRLGCSPFLTLKGDDGRLLQTAQESRLDVCISGANSDASYRLRLRLSDAFANEIRSSDHEIKEASHSDEPLLVPWTMPGLESGYYLLDADLAEGGKTVARRRTAFVVVKPTSPLSDSPFGWSLQSPLPQSSTTEIARFTQELGVGHVKIPLWSDTHDRSKALQLSELIDELTLRQIDVVGVLDPPPEDLRRKFADNWAGVAEVFELPDSLWAPSLAPLVARYGARVQDWQLGRDGDRSFARTADLQRGIESLKRAFLRVGRNSRFGVPWTEERPFDQEQAAFISVPIESEQFPVARTDRQNFERWAAIQPLPPQGYSPQERATNLVRRAVNARASGADRICLVESNDPGDGLVDRDGSPTELFLPWRTTALSLQDLGDLGTLTMENGSQNRIFGNKTQATVVIWNESDKSEALALGGTPQTTDLWGREQPLSIDDAGLTRVAVGPSPIFLTGFSPALLRWQLAAQFENVNVKSQHGPQALTIQGINPFDQGISAHVALIAPKGWELETDQWPLRLAANEEFRLPVLLSLPADTSLGSHHVELKFDIQADRKYSFSVKRELIVGLGDVEIAVAGNLLPDGRLEVVQSITNLTKPEEVLNFRCDLFVPGEQRLRQYVVKLGHGRDVRRYFIAEGASLVGRELRVRAEQENGRRVLNYRWTVTGN